MFQHFNLQTLHRVPQFDYYFRYPLHDSDFRELREKGRLRGHYAAKPLYGKLTAEGRVDRSAGFNGQVAVIFIPARARSERAAKLWITRMAKNRVVQAKGGRNWPAIRAAAERTIRRFLKKAIP